MEFFKTQSDQNIHEKRTKLHQLILKISQGAIAYSPERLNLLVLYVQL